MAFPALSSAKLLQPFWTKMIYDILDIVWRWSLDIDRRWSSDIVQRWSLDIVQRWSSDTVRRWSLDIVRHWSSDTVRCWSLDTVWRWSSDTFRCWSSKAVRHWCSAAKRYLECSPALELGHKRMLPPGNNFKPEAWHKNNKALIKAVNLKGLLGYCWGYYH